MATEQDAQPKKVAVIRIRGNVAIKTTISDTIKMLGIFRKNSCAIIDLDATKKGMLQKAKDYITWGEVDEDTVSLLKEKRKSADGDHGKADLNKGGEDKQPRMVFRLNPPRKGFERKGIKVPFTTGGALGYRGKNINDLIRRMV